MCSGDSSHHTFANSFHLKLKLIYTSLVDTMCYLTNKILSLKVLRTNRTPAISMELEQKVGTCNTDIQTERQYIHITVLDEILMAHLRD